MTYDEMILRGPEERPDPVLEECEHCKGTGSVFANGIEWDCTVCEGMGQFEAPAEEPDGDYEYERRRDAIADRG